MDTVLPGEGAHKSREAGKPKTGNKERCVDPAFHRVDETGQQVRAYGGAKKTLTAERGNSMIIGLWS